MPRSILIVDDASVLTAVLAELFAGEGFAVRTAPDGAVALEEHTRDPADLILSDVIMPIVDGPTLVSTLRECGDLTPVILMSAASQGATIPPDVLFLRKPFDIEYLFTVVDGMIPLQA